MGTNSIGWCAVELDESGNPCGILDAGVRILTPNDEAGRDPQSKASLAANRREARSARRRRDRFLKRQKRLMETLVDAGLMPADPVARKALESLDPYWLRARALDQKLDLHEIGRAIFHLNQRRGFKSNRIADAGDNEASAMKAGIAALKEALANENARTLGEFLARRHQRDRDGNRQTANPQAVRFRPRVEGAKALYDFYPYRELIEEELETIWAAQSAHHSQLTDALLARIKRIVVEQRPLKAPPVGRCTLRSDEVIDDHLGFSIDLGERTPKAHPLFQRFRILQDASQLRVARPGERERKLSLAEYRAVCAKLMASSGNSVTFDKLRKAAKLPEEMRFNYELAGRKGFQPDLTAVKLSHKNAFGKGWRNLPRDRQIEIVERLLAIEEPDVLHAWLTGICGLDDAAAGFVSSVRLPQGHGQFGRAVLGDLVEIMERGEDVTDPQTGEVYSPPLTYNEAVAALGLHHSRLSDRATHRRLPYYGEALARHVIAKKGAPEGSQDAIGRVPNPTVHIGLNQLRAVVNALIEVHGPPAEIVMELARELKLNKKRKDEIQRENRENERKNDEIRSELEAHGFTDTFGNRLLLKLYAELPPDERVCVYSGVPISKERLFSGAVDIDHILPHSKTLDDSFANKVLCTRESNRSKGNRAPGQAWSGEALQEIVERAERLFPRKAWRFQPDAMDTFEEKGGFQARHLVDTQHMSRMAREYLELVCDRVWVTPGRMTAMLRAKWALNDLLPDHNFTNPNQPKNRKDHRHHAIDAFVLACTSQGLLNRIARESGRAEELELDRLFPKDSFPKPFEGFREALETTLRSIIVSHKPDHGLAPGAQGDVTVTSGRLLEETAYGLVSDEIDGKHYNLVTRKPLAALKPTEIDRVRDARLREQLQELAYSSKRDGTKLEDALAAFERETGIRRVRILKTEKSVRTIEHGAGHKKAYVPGDNHRIEIFELPDGSWAGEGVTAFDANQPGYAPEWRQLHPNARLVMKVHNGDSIEADFGEGRQIFRVYQLEPSAKRIRMVPHNEAGSMQPRHNDPDDPLRWTFGSYSKLRNAGARLVRIDPIGRVQPVVAGS
jgi:CRISPR-associated endonuclease Csn1